MADLKDDDERTELLARRLTDDITAKVRSALFKFYAAMGSVAIVVAGYAGWSLWNDAITRAENNTEKTISERIQPKIETAEKKLDEAQAKLAEMEIEKRVAEQLQLRVSKSLDALDQLYEEARPKIILIDQAKVRLDEVDQKIIDVNQKIRDIDQKLIDVSVQAARAGASGGGIAALSQEVKKLGEKSTTVPL